MSIPGRAPREGKRSGKESKEDASAAARACTSAPAVLYRDYVQIIVVPPHDYTHYVRGRFAACWFLIQSVVLSPHVLQCVRCAFRCASGAARTSLRACRSPTAWRTARLSPPSESHENGYKPDARAVLWLSLQLQAHWHAAAGPAVRQSRLPFQQNWVYSAGRCPSHRMSFASLVAQL